MTTSSTRFALMASVFVLATVVSGLPVRNRRSTADLSDEFSSAASLNDWTNVYPASHSGMSVANGHLSITPTGTDYNGWYNQFTGVYLSKEVTGDFVAEMSFSVEATSGGAPDGPWHTAGLMVRSIEDEDDWILINNGNQGAFAPTNLPQTYGTEVKNTVNGVSEFNYQAGAMSGSVRVCRLGDDITMLRNLDGDGGWTVVGHVVGGTPGSVTRSDFGDTVDVGIMSNRFFPGSDSFSAEIDFVRFAVPTTQNDCSIADITSLNVEDTTTTVTTTTITTTTVTGTTTTQTTTTTTTPLPVSAQSDEFFHAGSLSDWTDHHPEMHSAMTIADGQLSLTPAQQPNNVWFQTGHGSFISKPITGNFVAETLMDVRVGDSGLPEGDWHSAGLMAQSTTDATSWVLLNMGNQGAWAPLGQTYGTEGKSTTSGVTEFDYSASTAQPLRGFLRICRVNQDFYLLRRLDGETSWSYQSAQVGSTPGAINRADMPQQLNVGIMANRFGNGGNDFTAHFDYIRFRDVSSLQDCTQAI